MSEVKIDVSQYKMSEAETEISNNKMSEGNAHVWEVCPSNCLRHIHEESDVSVNLHTRKYIFGQIITEKTEVYHATYHYLFE